MENEMVALILAGGKGTRLGGLTRKTAKPAVFFGGKYRIIDFVLSNCANSNIRNVGILTQYEAVELSNYCSSGHHWGFDGSNSELSILSPREKNEGTQNWYSGTASAIYQNLDYIDTINPKYVLILSSDHIYKMNYEKMLKFTLEKDADLTIGYLDVSLSEASRFGILNTDKENKVVDFIEKPKNPESTKASMGIYIFKYDVLKDALIKDSKKDSSHDFGKDIIPYFLKKKMNVYGYEFKGYWRDVGTIKSLWSANMDLIDDKSALDLYNEQSSFKIYSEDTKSLPQYIGPDAIVKNSIINQGSIIFGNVSHSVLFTGSYVEEGAQVINSVIMPNVHIGKNAIVKNAIVASNAIIEENRIANDSDDVVLINK